ncbi:MAG: protein kinase domain-containing protein [Gemmataceae bacterium]
MPKGPAQHNRNDEPIAGYRLTDFIGKGAFGEVWKAIDTKSGKLVAIKIIDLTASTAAQKELRAFNLIKNLEHPHLVPIFTARLKDIEGREIDFERAESARARGVLKALVIAMGLGQKSLSGRLKEFNPEGTPLMARRGIPVTELIPYIEGAAKGIDFLNLPTHNLGTGDGPIIHCDIKPDNILISNGEALIADCGVAVIVNQDVRRSVAAGSMAYNPPEQMSNKPTRGTDQYAFAISYYELRTGKLPFREDISAMELMTIHASGQLDFNSPMLVAREREVLKKATSVRPQDRFDTCVKFCRELARALADQLEGSINIPPPSGSNPIFGPGSQVLEIPIPAPLPPRPFDAPAYPSELFETNVTGNLQYDFDDFRITNGAINPSAFDIPPQGQAPAPPEIDTNFGNKAKPTTAVPPPDFKNIDPPKRPRDIRKGKPDNETIIPLETAQPKQGSNPITSTIVHVGGVPLLPRIKPPSNPVIPETVPPQNDWRTTEIPLVAQSNKSILPLLLAGGMVTVMVGGGIGIWQSGLLNPPAGDTKVVPTLPNSPPPPPPIITDPKKDLKTDPKKDPTERIKEFQKLSKQVQLTQLTNWLSDPQTDDKIIEKLTNEPEADLKQWASQWTTPMPTADTWTGSRKTLWDKLAELRKNALVEKLNSSVDAAIANYDGKKGTIESLKTNWSDFQTAKTSAQKIFTRVSVDDAQEEILIPALLQENNDTRVQKLLEVLKNKVDKAPLLTALLKELDRLAQLTSPSEKLTKERLAEIVKTIQDTPAAMQHATGKTSINRMASANSKDLRSIVLKGPISSELYAKWKDDNSPWAKAARAEWELMSGKYDATSVKVPAMTEAGADRELADYLTYLNAVRSPKKFELNAKATTLVRVIGGGLPDFLQAKDRRKLISGLLRRAVRRDEPSLNIRLEKVPVLEAGNTDQLLEWTKAWRLCEETEENQALYVLFRMKSGDDVGGLEEWKKAPLNLTKLSTLSARERVALGIAIGDKLPAGSVEQAVVRGQTAPLLVRWMQEEILETRKKVAVKQVSVDEIRSRFEGKDPLTLGVQSLLQAWIEKIQTEQKVTTNSPDPLKRSFAAIALARTVWVCQERFLDTEENRKFLETIGKDLNAAFELDPSYQQNAEALAYSSLLDYSRLFRVQAVYNRFSFKDPNIRAWVAKSEQLPEIETDLLAISRNMFLRCQEALKIEPNHPVANQTACRFYYLLTFSEQSVVLYRVLSEKQPELVAFLKFKNRIGADLSEYLSGFERFAQPMTDVKQRESSDSYLIDFNTAETLYFRGSRLFGLCATEALFGLERDSVRQTMGRASDLMELAKSKGYDQLYENQFRIASALEDLAWQGTIDPEQEFRKAIAAAELAVSIATDSEKNAAKLELGRIRYRAAMYGSANRFKVEDAERVFEDARRGFIKDTVAKHLPQTNYWLGMCALARKDMSSAITAFQESIDDGPRTRDEIQAQNFVYLSLVSKARIGIAAAGTSLAFREAEYTTLLSNYDQCRARFEDGRLFIEAAKKIATGSKGDGTEQLEAILTKYYSNPTPRTYCKETFAYIMVDIVPLWNDNQGKWKPEERKPFLEATEQGIRDYRWRLTRPEAQSLLEGISKLR